MNATDAPVEITIDGVRYVRAADHRTEAEKRDVTLAAHDAGPRRRLQAQFRAIDAANEAIDDARATIDDILDEHNQREGFRVVNNMLYHVDASGDWLAVADLAGGALLLRQGIGYRLRERRLQTACSGTLRVFGARGWTTR